MTDLIRTDRGIRKVGCVGEAVVFWGIRDCREAVYMLPSAAAVFSVLEVLLLVLHQ